MTHRQRKILGYDCKGGAGSVRAASQGLKLDPEKRVGAEQIIQPVKVVLVDPFHNMGGSAQPHPSRRVPPFGLLLGVQEENLRRTRAYCERRRNMQQTYSGPALDV